VLKIAKIIPVHKGGQKDLPGNYRPISILPVMSKIWESVIKDRINKYLEIAYPINSRQFGFTKQSNTLSACLEIINNLQTNYDKGIQSALLFIDLQKAFDCVNHELLIDKLCKIGFKGPALNLLKSYLNERIQMVVGPEKESGQEPVTNGVPQGSILGPLLFNIFINDIVKLKLKGSLTLFADDICIQYSGKNVSEIIKFILHDLALIDNWINKNKLSMNYKKTKILFIRNKNSNSDETPIKFNGNIIEQVKSFKYLGLIIDQKLNWSDHIEYVKNKISPIIGILYRGKQIIQTNMRKSIYFSFIHSHLVYVCALWGNANLNVINQLQILQNRALKIIFNKPFLYSTINLYKETQILNVDKIYFKEIVLLMYKIENNLIKCNIQLQTNSDIHMHFTRNARNIHLLQVHSKTGQQSIIHRGTIFYNSLNLEMKMQDLKTFNTMVKNLLLETNVLSYTKKFKIN
jgi:hypothetical protein